MVARDPDFPGQDQDVLGIWLARFEKLPNNIASEIALRAALRVLPAILTAMPEAVNGDRSGKRLVIAGMRAAHVGWSAAFHGKGAELTNALASAVQAMSMAAARSVETPRSAVQQSAIAALESSNFVRINPENARNHLGGALSAAIEAATALDEGEDIARAQMVQALETDFAATTRRSASLLREPLWLIDVRGDDRYVANFPMWVRRPFDAYDANPLVQDTPWGLWLAWYRAILPNTRNAEPRSLFGVETDVAIATLPNAFWERDPDIVMRDLRRIVDDGPTAAAMWSSPAAASEPADTTSGDAATPSVNGHADAASGEEPQHAADEATGAADDSVTSAAVGSDARAADDGEAPAAAPPVATDLRFIADLPDPADDRLSRAQAGFVLAGRLNRIWDEMNPPSYGVRARWEERLTPGFVIHIDAPWGGGKTTFAGFLARLLDPWRHAGPLPDWMRRLPLSDEKFWPRADRRPWHIVRFNAWRHQHVKPPWWIIHQAIRGQCMDGLRRERNRLAEPGFPPPKGSARHAAGPVRHGRWLWLWLVEIAWRLWTPEMRLALLALLLAATAIVGMLEFGWVKVEKGAVAITGLSGAQFWMIPLIVALGGAPAVWTLVRAMTRTLLPGTPDAAQNYALGAGDPLERFRRHFDRTMRRFRRPVLVLVDDLDRCDPAYVVELMRGVQTILVSPRVVFVLLGDRGWIEEAFAETHKAMAKVDIGGEHGFGGRFVEKAIQFSFVLPSVPDDVRRRYLRSLVGLAEPSAPANPAAAPSAAATAEPATAAAAPSDPSPEASAEPIVATPTSPTPTLPAPAASANAAEDAAIRAAIDAVIAEPDYRRREDRARALLQGEAFGRLDPARRAAFAQALRVELALRAAADETAIAATEHAIDALAPRLPANPRQIKRIVNVVSFLQEIARLEGLADPGGARWQTMTRWILLMAEWPQTWFTLSRYPGLIDLVHDPAAEPADVPDAVRPIADAIRRNAKAMQLLAYPGEGRWEAGRIDRDAIRWLSALMPPTSGRPLPAPASPPAGAAAPPAAAPAPAPPRRRPGRKPKPDPSPGR